MEILNKMNIRTKIILCFFLVIIISCKEKEQNSNQTILDSLPIELANKTWIPYYKGNTYKDLLRRSEHSVTRYVKTSKTSFSKLEGKMEYELVELGSKKIVKDDHKYIMLLAAPYLDYISLSWIDKQKGLIDIKYVYKKPIPIDVKDSIFTISYVDKSYITLDNFPEPEPEKIVLKEEKPIDSSIYSDIIDVLPLKGIFSCDYKENGYVYKEGILNLKENFARIKMEDVISVDLDIRKLKGSTNKYGLFYGIFYTKYEPPEGSQYYSKKRPVAEIEILDDNTIKKKWIGFYNKHTKKIENGISYFDWGDKHCDIIKRQ